jgi:hypothetical protein
MARESTIAKPLLRANTCTESRKTTDYWQNLSLICAHAIKRQIKPLIEVDVRESPLIY